jgi:hypothetical protein
MPERGQPQITDAELASLARALATESPYRRQPTLPAGGEADFYASSYAPTLRDQVAAYFVGDQRPTVERRRLVEGILGSSGSGHTSLGLADVTPGAPGYWLDAFDHLNHGEARSAVTDAAKAARVGIPYAIGANVLRRGQELGRFAPTVREGATLVGLLGSVAAEHDGRNPLYGPGSAFGGDETMRNGIAPVRQQNTRERPNG